MYVIGTAGHVDHGKSTLVLALTGIDPDRLREEKERGMTIDLGFAWLALPSGQEVSIVDVPGHERFIKNMLAGVGGIDLALLVVATDEGVMPQTREHLAILDLLEVRHGAVAITKRDLVDQEWLELVAAEVEEVLQPTCLAGAPLVPVSAMTGEGLPQLLQTLDDLLKTTPPKRDTGRPRLPVDRVFTIAGFGTVVTGTLIDGSLKVGQEVEVTPARLRSRIRGLQTHKHKVEQALPGNRVAANLAGLSTEQVARGDVVTTPGWLRPTATVDVRLRLLPDLPRPLAHNASLTFHSLASEVPAKVRLLDAPELPPGQTGWAQLRLQRPLALGKGDFFILRSSVGTVGGGAIVDPYPRRHRRFHAETLTSLATLEQGAPEAILLQGLEKAEPMELSSLLKTSSLSQEEARRNIAMLIDHGQVVALGTRALDPGSQLLRAVTWSRVEQTAQQALAEYHRQAPLRSGMSKEELRSRLRLPARASAEAVELLLQKGIIEELGPVVHLPGHRVELSPQQEAQARAAIAALEKEPYSPPADLPADVEVLNALVEQRRVVRVGESVLFSAPVYDRMVEQIVAHLKGRERITVAEVRDMFNTSRKYALALMEHLDQQHVTRRVGDERVLR
ncbi:MAG: selenocysteine-specific translation elongation factor [Chloroflexi bacterium]|nr:selenocysteine-specific translation elongation factor [Chloroflexota bacterium]